MIDEHERTLWDAVLLVIKEANGRYGLKLYGHMGIKDWGMFTLTWLAGNGQYFEMPVSYEACFSNPAGVLIDLVLRNAAPLIREMAERRDKTDRALRVLEGLRSL